MHWRKTGHRLSRGAGIVPCSEVRVGFIFVSNPQPKFHFLHFLYMKYGDASGVIFMTIFLFSVIIFLWEKFDENDVNHIIFLKFLIPYAPQIIQISRQSIIKSVREQINSIREFRL
jgi:hypothetical protein